MYMYIHVYITSLGCRSQYIVTFQKKVGELEVKCSVLQAELADMEALRNKLSNVEKSYRDLEASKEVSLFS